MTVSEKIFKLLETVCAEQGAERFQGLDTKIIAAELGIWPNNVSVALNALVREGRLRTEARVPPGISRSRSPSPPPQPIRPRLKTSSVMTAACGSSSSWRGWPLPIRRTAFTP